MSSGTNTERITQNNTKISTNNTAIDNFKTAINNLPSGANKVQDGVKFGFSSVFPNNIDTSEMTDMSYFFGSSSFNTMNEINTSKVTNMQAMFSNNSNIITILQLNTSKATTMKNMFTNCASIVNIPQLDGSSIYEPAVTNDYFQNMFTGCNSLSNESLNNILAMCSTMRPHYTHKNLKRLGLSQTQATTCTTLSNWTALQQAGWTTGY